MTGQGFSGSPSLLSVLASIAMFVHAVCIVLLIFWIVHRYQQRESMLRQLEELQKERLEWSKRK